MGKKDKSKKDKSVKWDKRLQKIELELAKNRKKMLKVLGKMARMDVQDYVFKNREGQDVKLSELFGDKEDLVLIHNMGKSCSYCTMWADGFNGIFKHIQNRAGFALVSPDAHEVQRDFADSRGWKFPMFSGADSTFIKDMGYQTEKGDYWPGASAFHKDSNGNITRVSKTYFGPGDFYCSVWHFFDMLPQKETEEKQETNEE
jgi:predicted dithiol-disulfide oxidoreductase (DUF899 family)